MTYDMFKCPKCGCIVDEHDWTMTSDDEDGFECKECNTVYFGDELTELVDKFYNNGSEALGSYDPFAD
jgi:phage FluMu protein Com